MVEPPPGPKGPVGVPRGQNAFNTFLTAMARDVPRQLKRSARMRAQLRKGRR